MALAYYWHICDANRVVADAYGAGGPFNYIEDPSWVIPTAGNTWTAPQYGQNIGTYNGEYYSRAIFLMPATPLVQDVQDAPGVMVPPHTNQCFPKAMRPAGYQVAILTHDPGFLIALQDWGGRSPLDGGWGDCGLVSQCNVAFIGDIASAVAYVIAHPL